MSEEELRQLKEQLDELLQKGYIMPSDSEWGSAAMMVPKPGQPDKLRLVVDYRAVNNRTVVNRYPLPNIDQMLERLNGCKVFSTFDAIWGFWQMPLAPSAIPKTAMTTPFGSYAWRCLPMGLTNSPS